MNSCAVFGIELWKRTRGTVSAIKHRRVLSKEGGLIGKHTFWNDDVVVKFLHGVIIIKPAG